jgi:error-prone DNA polymerase
MVEGKLQIEGEVIHVIVERCYNYSRLLRKLVTGKGDDLSLTTSRADERSEPATPGREKKQGHEMLQKKIFPEGRNFK